MKSIFRRAKQNRIYQDVVDQIQEAILDGRLQNGEKLPAERELCELFQTSRGTLREALRVLEHKGLIEIKVGVGGGAVVKRASADPITESLAMLIRSGQVSLEHLSEFREEVEGTVTGIAAIRADREDLDQLDDLISSADAFYREGSHAWKDFVRVDEKIHMKLAEITGNPIYRFILRTIHDNIDLYYHRFLSVGETEMEENYRDLKEIVDAVRQRDADQAGFLAREHVRRFNVYMEKKKRQMSAQYKD
jgi:DNA-binding FadR family transcriptional regulator